jgi:cytochrome c peroxidase
MDGRRGARNAPSLVGVADRTIFFWDGRRDRLDAVVLDPLTHPAEMGWSDLSDLSHKLQGRPSILRRFKRAFPSTEPLATGDQISQALVAFLKTLKTGRSKFDQAQAHQGSLSSEAEFGMKLFVGVAQCSQCHTLEKANSTFTDDQFHHSSIGNISQSEDLPSLVKDITDANVQKSQLGHKVLLDLKWSALGRFVASLRPVDIGAFRTPSLRNVAVTAPYMHDGSIATLREAVDHEIYYRGFSSGRPINLSAPERRALVAFLEALTDEEYANSTVRMARGH